MNGRLYIAWLGTVLLLLSGPAPARSQNTIGLPDIINYARKTYQAGLQNWDIRQDSSGVMYFANNEGLLSYDGSYWRLYPLPNRTIVRSIALAGGRIYVGGQDELGYFSPGPGGDLSYHSLTNLLPAKERKFGDVWDIVHFQKDIFFRTTNRIFQYGHEAMGVFPASSEWSYLGIAAGKLYAHDFQQGLLQFSQEAWKPLSGESLLASNDPVTGIIDGPGDSSYVTTLKSGVFLLTGDRLSALNWTNNPVFRDARIYAAARISDNQLALASSTGGVYITDRQGNIIQRFTKAEGLQTNNVLSIFTDQQRNLWLGLDNGIDFISYNSAIKQINPREQEGSGYTALIHDHRFYLGTSSGLYSVPLQELPDLSFSKGDFQLVAGSQGQVWALDEINGQLLMGHHEGAFLVNQNGARQISSQPGFWNFTPLSPIFPSSEILAGNYRGVMRLHYANGRFNPEENIPGFSESSRFIAIDGNENIWVSHPYHGVYKIQRQNNGNYIVRLYTAKDGLPSTLNNHVYKLRNEVVVATEKGIYRYQDQTDRFEPIPFYQQILGNLSIRYLRDDPAGNLWFIHDKTLGVIDFSSSRPELIYLPELNNKMVSGFEYIYPVDERNIFLGGEKGFYLINYEKYRRSHPNLSVQVRKVVITGTRDSLLYGGYTAIPEETEPGTNAAPRLASRWKTLHFEFTAPLYGYQNNLEFSYQLKGFDDAWSDWSTRTEKEYTNLPAGSYHFLVKVRNNLGNESPASEYAFVILPPWYLSLWAKLVYFILLLSAGYALYLWQRRKFVEQQIRHEAEQQRLQYIHDLERNKTASELMNLRNEKLEAEINFKNSELASSAMHLVKKSELLTRIKSELSQMMKRLQHEEATTEIKKMIRALNEDDTMDKDWEHFTQHFDKVHSDFVSRLKEKYPNISANELKLCAYLRMNMTSKEIAQVMNISVRGVEISRYRLRKKLGLSSDQSLFDHLINISGKE